MPFKELKNKIIKMYKIINNKITETRQINKNIWIKIFLKINKTIDPNKIY